MTDWIFPLVYAAGFVYTTRYIGGALAWDSPISGNEPDGDDYMFGFVMGAIIALFWPVTLPIALTRGYLRYALAKPERVRASEKRRELDERERRIRELERSVGIKG